MMMMAPWKMLLPVLLMVPTISISEKVGEELLKRIQTTSHGTENKGNNRNIFESPNLPRVSVLERARNRYQQLLGARSQSKSPKKLEPKRNFPFSSRIQLLGGECQAFKTENSILRQQLLAVQTQLQQLERRKGQELDGPVRTLQLLNSVVNNKEDSSQVIRPLDRLLQKVAEAPPHISLSRILITPTPTISTILDTTSFVTTVTNTLTRELLVNFHGTKLPTQILDVEVKVQTVTSILSSTIEITPTPSWQTLAITPTVISPPSLPAISNINVILEKQSQEQDRQAHIDRIRNLNKPKTEEPRSIGGGSPYVADIPKAIGSFESFQAYLKNIRQLKRGKNSSFYSESSNAIPIASVSISGSIPGKYSTSLIKINFDEEGHPLYRRRRQISPSSSLPVSATQRPEISEDKLEDLSDVEILSSFRVDNAIDAKTSELLEHHTYKTVTVTVTQSGMCLP